MGFVDTILDIEGGDATIPFIEHVLFLDNLIKVGASIEINDLTKEEWDGLILLRKVRLDVETELMKQEQSRREAQRAVSDVSRRSKR